MRRLLVTCVLAVMGFAVFAMVQRVYTQAAGSTKNLTLTSPAPPAGCPLGAAYTFCNTLVGGTSAQSVFTVTNISAASVTNVSYSFAAFPGQSGSFAAADYTTSTTCGAALTPNASCTITISFTPTATGVRRAVLTVKDTQGDAASVDLAGTAANLAITTPASPAGCTQDNAFTFCDVLAGAASSPSQFTLDSKNAVSGVAIPLAAVPGLASEFNAADFKETSSCGVTLGPNSTCPINIEFTPTVASMGVRAAELNVTDAQGDAVTIFLSGYVSSAGNTTSNLTLTPTSAAPNCAFGNPFGYCNEPIGGTSASRTFTLANTSGSSVTGINIPFPVTPLPPAVATPTDFTVQTSTCSSTLLAHSSCTINIAFTPTTTGSRQGSVTVTDVQGDLAMINFTGYGDDFQLQLAPAQASEITILPGGSATFKAQVVSDGVFGAQGEMVEFICPDNVPALSTCSFTPCPVSVTPGTPTSFSVIFMTSSPTLEVAPITSSCPGNTSAVLLVAPKRPVAASLFTTALAGTFYRRGWLPPALIGMCMMAVLGIRYRNASLRRTLRPVGVLLFVAAVLAGCHHAAAPTGGTPIGATTMVIQGQALDANGVPLNASRSLPPIILDVETN